MTGAVSSLHFMTREREPQEFFARNHKENMKLSMKHRWGNIFLIALSLHAEVYCQCARDYEENALKLPSDGFENELKCALLGGN